MKKINSEICFVGPQKTPALFDTYFDEDAGTMTFVVRAGMFGRGGEIAREECPRDERSQFETMKKIREQLGGLYFEESNQAKK